MITLLTMRRHLLYMAYISLLRSVGCWKGSSTVKTNQLLQRFLLAVLPVNANWRLHFCKFCKHKIILTAGSRYFGCPTLTCSLVVGWLLKYSSESEAMECHWLWKTTYAGCKSSITNTVLDKGKLNRSWQFNLPSSSGVKTVPAN